jgi:alanyl-tRNA synthetase
MRALGDRLKAGGAGAIILGSVRSGRPTLVVMVAAEAASSGVDAVAIVRKGAGVMGGSGGGKPEMAQAGGKVPEALDKALASAKEEAIRLITRNSREGGE